MSRRGHEATRPCRAGSGVERGGAASLYVHAAGRTRTGRFASPATRSTETPLSTRSRIVRRQVSTLDKLRAYCREPVCLTCGYNLRGLAAAGRDRCPECGAPCGRRNLLEQLGSLPDKHNPVVQELNLGVAAVLLLPILPSLVGLPVGHLLVLVGRSLEVSAETSGWLRWLPPATIIVALISLWAASPWLARRAFGGRQGVSVWWRFNLLVAAGLIGVAGIAIWSLLGVASGAAAVLEDHPDPVTIHLGAIELGFGDWRTHALAAAAGALLQVSVRLWRPWVSNPCRARCRALAARWLDESGALAGGNGSNEPPQP